MEKTNLIDQLVQKGNGYLKTSDVLQSGISKTTLARYTKLHGMERVAHGVYLSENAWPDDYYLLHLCNKRIVFSNESALYLYGLTDREPSVTTVTVPDGYNSEHLKGRDVKVIHTKRQWYEMGQTEVMTGMGNPVPVYDRERTICDIIRHKKDIEIQTFQTAIQEYMRSKGKNLTNLMKYAEQLGVDHEVRMYTEVML